MSLFTAAPFIIIGAFQWIKLYSHSLSSPLSSSLCHLTPLKSLLASPRLLLIEFGSKTNSSRRWDHQISTVSWFRTPTRSTALLLLHRAPEWGPSVLAQWSYMSSFWTWLILTGEAAAFQRDPSINPTSNVGGQPEWQGKCFQGSKVE